MMAVRTRPEASLAVAGGSVLYVDFLEVAPWNLTHPRQYSGCGTQLLAEAVRVSWAMGLGGGIGLHAINTAVGYYRQLGMTDLGDQPYYGSSLLPYFEFTPPQAAAWYTQGRFGSWPPQ